MTENPATYIRNQWIQLRKSYSEKDLQETLKHVRGYQIRLIYLPIIRFVVTTIIVIAAALWFLSQPDIYITFLGYSRYVVHNHLPSHLQRYLSRVYSTRCILDNPFFNPEKSFPLEECGTTCKSVHYVPTVLAENIRPLGYQYDYLFQNKPLVVRAGITLNDPYDWREVFPPWETFSQLRSSLFGDKHAATRQPIKCPLESNLRLNPALTPFSIYLDAVERLEQRKQAGWFLYWENCHKWMSKLLRPYYRRSSLIPRTSRYTSESSIFLAFNITDSKWITIPHLRDVVLLYQLSGQYTFRLVPKEPCSDSDILPASKLCSQPTASQQLNQGDILLLPDHLWDVQLKAQHNGQAGYLGAAIILHIEHGK
jgi:hypothetical protein